MRKEKSQDATVSDNNSQNMKCQVFAKVNDRQDLDYAR